MPLSPSVSSGVRGSDAANPTLSTGAAKLAHTLTGVTATHAGIVVTNAYKLATASGELVTGVTIGGAAANPDVRIGATDSLGHRTETCIWSLENLTAGDKAVVLTVSGPLYVNWHADSWAIGVTSPLDKTETATHLNPGTTAVPVPVTGTTATLSQASELVIASAASKFSYAWGGAYGGGGTPPAGYTLLAGLTEDNVNQCNFQSVYRETTTTGGVSAAFAVSSTDANTTGAIATFKITTVQRRVRVRAAPLAGGPSFMGATGLTVHAWPGNPKDSVATEWLGLTAEAAEEVVFLSNPPAAWAVGADVNVIVYQPSGALGGTSWVRGRVEEY